MILISTKMRRIRAHMRYIFSLFMKFGVPPPQKKKGGGGPDPQDLSWIRPCLMELNTESEISLSHGSQLGDEHNVNYIPNSTISRV